MCSSDLGPRVFVPPAEPRSTSVDIYEIAMMELLRKGLVPPATPSELPPTLTPWLLNEAAAEELVRAFALHQQYMDALGFQLACAQAEKITADLALRDYDAKVRQAIRQSEYKCTKDEMADMLALAEGRRAIEAHCLLLETKIVVLRDRVMREDEALRTISRSVEVRRQVMERDRTGTNLPHRRMG